MSDFPRKEIIPQEHWMSLTTSDWRPVLDIIPVLELEFQRMETFVGGELSAEAAIRFYDFDDLSWKLFSELAYIGVVRDELFGEDVSAYQSQMDSGSFHEVGYLKICELLAFCTRQSAMDSGYFERKLKDKTILSLLQALRYKLQNCCVSDETFCG